MLKKIFFCTSAVAMALGFNSCSSDIEAPATGDDGMVVFTAKMPGTVNSRAYSDGTGAKKLAYAVYEANTDNLIYSSDQTDAPQATYNNNLTFTLAMKLVKGQNYDFIFWADNQECSAYTFNPANKSVSINYEGIESNDETRDAFFTAEKDMLVTGAMQKNIQLYRPFAQLNIGTNDIDEAKRAGTVLGTTQVVVKDVYSELNLLSGEASNATDVTYAYAELPEGETFPVDGYDYLSMNYILTGEQILDENVNSAQKETRDITIAIQDADGKPVNEFNVSAVPFQRNYRTNIYGSLLTSTVDFVIEIVPDYNDPDNDVNLNGYVLDEVNKTVQILNVNGLMWMRNETNSASNSFKGYTITLEDDIDLADIEWIAIGNNSQGKDKNSMNWFEGSFDGQGHTISNLKCYDNGNYSVAGLFGAIRGNIRNLKIEGADIKSEHYAGAIAAYAHANNASQYNDITFPADGFFIENCEVSNATVTTTPNKQADGSYDNGDKAGVLMGYTNTIMTITGCKVSNSIVEAYRDLGALVGYIGGNNAGTLPIIINNNQASDIKLIQNFTNGYKEESAVAYRHGTWYGWKDYEPASCENNTENNVTYEVFVTEGVAKDAEGNYVINTPAGMVWMSNQVNTGANNFRGKTIKLGCDIDMAGVEYEPCGNVLGYPTTTFTGTFDGCNYTISNLTASDSGKEGYASAGLFGSSTGVLKNIRLTNINISSTHYAGGIVGFSSTNVGFVIDNCHVDGGTISSKAELINGEWDNGDKAGGIIGYTVIGDQVTNCSVKNVTISAYRDLGGLVGYSGGATITDNRVENVVITVDNEHNYKNYTTIGKGGNDAGEIIGEIAKTGYDNGNTATGVTITTVASDSEQLNNLIAGATAGSPMTITLTTGTYSTKNMTIPNGVTLIIKGAGAGKTIIAAEPYQAAHDADLTFENLTIETTKMAGTELGFYHIRKGTYRNVTFKGETFNYASESETYENCTFEPNFDNGTNKYSIWCYGATTSVFNNCTFNNNKGKGILVYNNGDSHNYDITINNCQFNVTSDGATETVTDKGVIEIHTEAFTTNTKGTIRIDNATFDNAYGAGLWNELNNLTGTKTEYFTIIVDGVTVQESSR